MIKRILVALTICMYIYGPEIEIAAQTVPGNEIRLTSRVDPAPLSGRYRVWIGQTDGLLHCIKPDGSNCISATTSITIGTTTTGAAGTSAAVTNSGTSSAPVLNFTIPQGLTGGTGPAGQGFTFRGAWAPSTAYNAYDVVTNGGQTYEASTSFTSGATFNATNWNLWAAASSGGTGTVTSFTTTSWPTWLTPTVTNSTTTPNLDVSGGIVPEANGGTGSNNAPGAAGHVLRSNGTHYVDSTIQVADVPTLNQNTTGRAAANIASWSSSVSGGITVTANTNQNSAQTLAPAGITIIAFTMALGTQAAGCTTSGTWQLWDNTTSAALATVTVANATSLVSSTGLSAAVTSGDTLVIRVGTAPAGCTTNPGSATWTAWYKTT